MSVVSVKGRRVLATVAVASIVLLLGLGAAIAGTGYYTKGDAEAVLSAYPPGGGAIVFHAGHRHVGPARAYVQDALSIRPISPFFDKARYCVLDWHAVALVEIDAEVVVHLDEPFVYTRDDALSFLRGVHDAFFLDGKPFPTTEMPIQPYLERGFLNRIETELEQEFKAEVTIGDAWAKQTGRAVSPSELSVGRHRLSATSTHPAFPDYTDGITFYVDPPESSTCTRT
jgi:hypothetical protein